MTITFKKPKAFYYLASDNLQNQLHCHFDKAGRTARVRPAFIPGFITYLCDLNMYLISPYVSLHNRTVVDIKGEKWQG